jgi:hypothetical protein
LSFQRYILHHSNLLIISANIFFSHTGVAMAAAFQKMLKRFGLTDKIHAVNADNTLANNKLMAKLTTLYNSFEKDNLVHCFNHTMQLSVKTLLVPFDIAISQKATQDDEMLEEDNKDDKDDGIDKLGELSESKWPGILESTAAI